MRQITLNFHGLGEPERVLEPGEAPYWIGAEMFADILALVDRLADRVATTITFDDGNVSDLSIAAPALDRVGRRATFFVLSDRIGQPGSLSSDDMRALAEAGHKIGNHGAAHTDWRALDRSGQRREWEDARKTIADALGLPVDEAAIPFGRYRGGVIRGLKSRDYVCAWSSDGGTWKRDAFLRPRLSVRADMTLAGLEAALLGQESALRTLRRRLAIAIKQRV